MIMRTRPRGYAWAQTAVSVVALTFAASTVASGQQPQSPLFYEMLVSGQNVAPAFEGWEENPDGTFNMVFGYFNRNWEEQPDIPIGPNNSIEPGSPDQGQPTHFFPRRNKFVFRVKVPKDFGSKELVWTLAVHGKTEKAYATLKPDYKVEKRILQTDTHMRLSVRGYADFDKDMEGNTPPVVQVEGDSHRTVKVGEPLALNAVVTDDGRLKLQKAPLDSHVQDTTALGLRVAWFVYRGPADKVRFDPEQFNVYQNKKPGGNSPWTPGWVPPPIPADGKFPVKVTFGAPGTFVVRLMAHDGGLDTTKDVTVTVIPVSTASVR